MDDINFPPFNVRLKMVFFDSLNHFFALFFSHFFDFISDIDP
jgi:hypothetical protein